MTHLGRACTAALLALGLAACGGGSTGSERLAAPTAPDPTVSPSSEPSSEPSASSSSEPTAQPSEGPSAAPTRTTAAPAVAAPQRCAHPTEGYAVTFPADWHVAQDPDIEPCTFFDPRPLALEPGTEADGVAVRLDVLDAPLAEARRALEEDGMRATSEEAVDGHAAVRLQGETTEEEVLLPPGLAVTTWLVDLRGRTLLLTTDEGGTDPYADAVEVLDAMARAVAQPG